MFQSPFHEAIILWNVWRGGLPLDSVPSEGGLVLFIELSPTVRAYDVDLETLKSYVIIDDVSQRLRGVSST